MNLTTKLYVSQFRIKELKAILERLSLPTGGRKADLQNRVLAYFGEPLPLGVRCNVAPARDPWKIQAAGKPYSCSHTAVHTATNDACRFSARAFND